MVAANGSIPTLLDTGLSLEECINKTESVRDLTGVVFGTATYSSVGMSENNDNCWVFSDYRNLAIDKSVNDSVSSFMAGIINTRV